MHQGYINLCGNKSLTDIYVLESLSVAHRSLHTVFVCHRILLLKTVLANLKCIEDLSSKMYRQLVVELVLQQQDTVNQQW